MKLSLSSDNVDRLFTYIKVQEDLEVQQPHALQTDIQHFWPLPKHFDNLKTSHPFKKLSLGRGGGRALILLPLKFFRVTGFILHIFSYNEILTTRDKVFYILSQTPLAFPLTTMRQHQCSYASLNMYGESLGSEFAEVASK